MVWSPACPRQFAVARHQRHSPRPPGRRADGRTDRICSLPGTTHQINMKGGGQIVSAWRIRRAAKIADREWSVSSSSLRGPAASR